MIWWESDMETIFKNEDDEDFHLFAAKYIVAATANVNKLQMVQYKYLC